MKRLIKSVAVLLACCFIVGCQPDRGKRPDAIADIVQEDASVVKTVDDFTALWPKIPDVGNALVERTNSLYPVGEETKALTRHAIVPAYDLYVYQDFPNERRIEQIRTYYFYATRYSVPDAEDTSSDSRAWPQTHIVLLVDQYGNLIRDRIAQGEAIYVKTRRWLRFNAESFHLVEDDLFKNKVSLFGEFGAETQGQWGAHNRHVTEMIFPSWSEEIGYALVETQADGLNLSFMKLMPFRISGSQMSNPEDYQLRFIEDKDYFKHPYQ